MLRKAAKYSRIFLTLISQFEVLPCRNAPYYVPLFRF
jgi:hypothetical protein